MKKNITLLALLVLSALLAWAAILLLPPSSVSPQTEFLVLDGRKISLKTLRGRPVLVSFWATSCAPCVEEIPDLVRLYNAWHPLGFELIAVAMPYDPPALVQEFTQRRELPYPVALDVQGRLTSAFGGVPYVPAAFLIAPNGNIVMNSTGRLDIDKTRRIISRYLKESGS